MAVALATLPLKSLLAGDGDTLLTTGAGAGLATGLVETLAGFAGFAGLLGLLLGFVTGLTACFAAGLADLTTCLLGAGLAWGFAAGLPLLILLFPTATFFGAGFFAATFLATGFFATGFLTNGVFTTGFLTTAFLTTTFFATTFLTAGLAFFGCGLATAFRATGLLAAFLLATTFFATALLAGLAAARLVFAGALLAFFTIRPFVAAVFDAPALAVCALAAVLPFCALAALELPVVFAISLHRGWP